MWFGPDVVWFGSDTRIEQVRSVANVAVKTMHITRIANREIMQILLNIIAANTTVVTLYMSDCLQTTDAMELARILKTNRTLRCIVVKNNHISDNGIVALTDALATNSVVERVDVSHNDFTTVGIAALCRLIALPHCTLKSLCMGNRPLSFENMWMLAAALKCNTSLVHFSLDGCRSFGAYECTELFADALKKNTTLQTLDLRNTYIGDRDAVILSHAFAYPTTALTSISLCDNYIRDDGAQALSDAVEQNPRLVCLDVKHSPMGSAKELDILKRTRRNAIRRLIATLSDMILPGSALLACGTNVYSIIATKVMNRHVAQATTFDMLFDYKIFEQLLDDHLRFVLANWERLT